MIDVDTHDAYEAEIDYICIAGDLLRRMMIRSNQSHSARGEIYGDWSCTIEPKAWAVPFITTR
jgi:hypothetical protein